MLNFSEWRQAVCALAQNSSQEQDLLERNFLQRASRTAEEVLSGALFPRCLLQRSSKSGEDCTDEVLEPRWSNLVGKHWFFPIVSCY
jgi:hypothetical protein